MKTFRLQQLIQRINRLLVSEPRPDRIKPRHLKWVLTVCALFTLNACTTLGPDYKQPDIDWLDKWQPDLYGQIDDNHLKIESDLTLWWRLFDDPVLNTLIKTAKQKNPTLRIAGLRILENRAILGIADSSLYPQAQQVSGSVNYVNSQQHGGRPKIGNQELTNYQAGFGIGWELDFWGRFRRGIESADAAFFASIANQQAVQVLLSAQVADLYFAYRTTSLRIVIARENVAIQKRSFEITEQLFKSGQESELDFQQAKTQYLATLSIIPSLEIGVVKARNALSSLLGQAPGQLAALDPQMDALPEIGNIKINAIPASLLLRRPDIRAAALQVAAQSAQIGIAEADFYPAISLIGSIGWSGNNQSNAADVSSLAIGPNLTWNIFDYGRIRNNVRLQDARLQIAIESYQDSVLQAAREIDDAAISVIKIAERQLILTQSLLAAERSLEIANTNYREGYATFQRVLDAQRAVFSQSENELLNQGSSIEAVINFYKAMGGGWVVTAVDELIPDATRTAMEERSDWGSLLTAPLNSPNLPKGSETLSND